MQHYRDDMAPLDIASAILHEINQPLTAIMSYSQSCLYIMNDALDYDALCKKLSQPLEQIALQASLAGKIINHMNSFTNKNDFIAETLDINVLIRETIAVLNHEALAFKLKVTLNLLDGIPPIMANKTYIMQVILNLARNSIDALQSALTENAELIIETYLVEGDVVVHVIDNGPGIPAHLHNKILHQHFTTKTHGSGIGLRVSRLLVEAHGGELRVHPGEGAWFSFTLPVSSKNQ